MGDDLFLCIASCHSINSSGALVGNDSYDLECITQCSQRHTTLYRDTAEKYTHILQIIAVVLMTFGLIGKVFNCIIFLRKPLRGTSTGLLLFLKTIFDTFPLLWTFIFDTKFFVKDEQINASHLLCALSRSSDIFVSWSIGFVILACTVRLATIVRMRCLPEPKRLRVFALILLTMLCGLLYNWHVFYYPSLVTTILGDEKNHTFTYCNVLFGRQMGYFSFGGFQSTQEMLYNAPIVNFIVSSLIPFTIVASTNIVIILSVLRSPSMKRLSTMAYNHNGHHNASSDKVLSQPLNEPMAAAQITKKAVSYETTITLTTSCVFLTTNSIASIYVYVKSSRRSTRSRLTEDLKTSNVYLILRMLTLIDTVVEFYIYVITGKKFRQEVYQVLSEIFQRTPLRRYFNAPHSNTENVANHCQDPPASGQAPTKNSTGTSQPQYLNLTQSTSMSPANSYHGSPHKYRAGNSPWCDTDETLDRIESTV